MGLQITIKSQKVVTKPAPECIYPGAKAGVQENYNCFKILDSGFPAGLPGNDENGPLAIFYVSFITNQPIYIIPWITPESLGVCRGRRRISLAPALASISMICSSE